MKAMIKTLLSYGAVLLADMLLLSLFMHIDIFSSVTVYYYRTLYKAALVVVITIAALIGLFFLNKKKGFTELVTPTFIMSSGLLCGMAMVLFVTLGPLTIDRSYTIFELADMAENENRVFTAEEVEERFSDIYIHQYGSTARRIEEQLSIGNMVREGEGYRITEKGKRLIGTFRLVEKLYPVEDTRIIYPEYANEEEEAK